MMIDIRVIGVTGTDDMMKDPRPLRSRMAYPLVPVQIAKQHLVEEHLSRRRTNHHLPLLGQTMQQLKTRMA